MSGSKLPDFPADYGSTGGHLVLVSRAPPYYNSQKGVGCKMNFRPLRALLSNSK